MKFSLVFVLVCVGLALAEERVHYDGYKVYQVTPKTEDEAKVIMGYMDNPAIDFWSQPRMLNAPIEIMVAPDAQEAFVDDLNSKNVELAVLIEDVESTFREEEFRKNMSGRLARGSVSFTTFMRYDDIVAYLETLAQTYPNIAQLVILGQSFEGRNIVGLKISSGGTDKPIIFVDAGIHAREWIAPPTALFIINQLVENPNNANLYSDVDWVVIPSLNPDGYEFTHTSTRLWRKTRTPNTLCYGVDPNRNFDYFWMLIGASNQQCSEIYAGPVPFSEPETLALRNYLLAYRDQIKLYLTFHSHGQYLLYPWGYTSALPEDNDELYGLGELVNIAIRSVAGTSYTIGTSTNVLYAAAGGSDDYAKGVVGIQLSYTIELPSGGSTGFDPPASRILPIVEETWEGVKAYHGYIEHKFAN